MSSSTPASEYERWQATYAGDEFVFGERPNVFLARQKARLPIKGRALAVADGEGRNGVWLAEQGLDVVSIDFSPNAQEKARRLAAERGVAVEFILADAHSWSYPNGEFDLVVEIFTQFSSPQQRIGKWEGMKRSLRKGGLLLIEGYTPRQLLYGTGGPKAVENLYTRELLAAAFADMSDVEITEYDAELTEGARHVGRSAVIDLVAIR